jgi:hypothetical protein
MGNQAVPPAGFEPALPPPENFWRATLGATRRATAECLVNRIRRLTCGSTALAVDDRLLAVAVGEWGNRFV